MKKNQFFNWFFLSMVVLFFLDSCKYKEGPFISFRTRKERMVNTWKIDKFDHDGVDITKNFQYITLNIKKDETFELVASDPSNNTLVLQHFKTMYGNWFFSADDERVTFEFLTPNPQDSLYGSRDEWTILRLMEKEVWMEISLPGKHNRKEVILKPQ